MSRQQHARRTAPSRSASQASPGTCEATENTRHTHAWHEPSPPGKARRPAGSAPPIRAPRRLRIGVSAPMGVLFVKRAC